MNARMNDPMALHTACARAGLGYSMGWVRNDPAMDYEVELRAKGERLFYLRGQMMVVIDAAIRYTAERLASDAAGAA